MKMFMRVSCVNQNPSPPHTPTHHSNPQKNSATHRATELNKARKSSSSAAQPQEAAGGGGVGGVGADAKV